MNDKKKKIIVVAVVSLLVIVAVVLCSTFLFKEVEEQEYKEEEKVPTEVIPEKKLNIIDVNSNTRSIAVMVNNHATARAYHSGLQDAYLVYEIIVEGGITRMLAVYKDADTSKIGSVRSARHYFLDYALENDAIYVHHGNSPQAYSDFSSLGINRIEINDSTSGWRDKSLGISSEHTLFTNMEKLNSAINKKGLRSTSDKDTLLNYNVDEIDLSEMNGAKLANNVSINYSGYASTSYVYDSENKVYKRSVNGKAHVDYLTKKQYTAKNIITYQVANSTISGDKKGRQNLNNVGSGEGYYISNGYAVPIKWSKSSRSAQTVYTYLDGTEINVNDGNTYIQIQPVGKKLVIE